MTAAGQSGAAIALMIFTFIFFWFVCGLSGFHTWLVATNQTTYENFRWGSCVLAGRRDMPGLSQLLGSEACRQAAQAGGHAHPFPAASACWARSGGADVRRPVVPCPAGRGFPASAPIMR